MPATTSGLRDEKWWQNPRELRQRDEDDRTSAPALPVEPPSEAPDPRPQAGGERIASASITRSALLDPLALATPEMADGPAGSGAELALHLHSADGLFWMRETMRGRPAA